MSDAAARRIFVGLGSNLDEPRQQLIMALAALAQSPDLTLLQCSRLWRSEPWGEPAQPDFFNAVVELQSELAPTELLHRLKVLEGELGRVPAERRWGPRRIDLDLLAVGKESCNDQDLVLPHPKLDLRRFVLAPWADIAADFVLPGGASVNRLLADCPDRGEAEPVAPLTVVVRVADLRRRIAAYRRQRQSVALVPTMGNLHEGHLSLVQRARESSDRVVVSLFVNPTQFGPGEDLASYPRTLAADCEALLAAGCDLLWVPRVTDVYPHGLDHPTRVQVPVPAAGQLCDGGRPGHFAGVATVVARLLNAVNPDNALFGQKDYQQLLLIRRMASDLLMPVTIESVPIVREPSGLAMSSRNLYLSPREREQAAQLSATLRWLAAEVAGGEQPVEDLLASGRKQLEEAGLAPEYLEIRSARDLGPMQQAEGNLVVLAAARLGKTRLIDNILVPKTPA